MGQRKNVSNGFIINTDVVPIKSLKFNSGRFSKDNSNIYDMMNKTLKQ